MKLVDILRILAQPVPKNRISKKGIFKNKKKIDEVDYIAWVDCCDLLDQFCGLENWEWSVRDVNQISNRLTLTGVLTIHGDDKNLTRMATGTEDVDCSSYGDPSSNAEAMALRRCCAKFGLGRDLWRKESKAISNQSTHSRQRSKPIVNQRANTNIPKNSPAYWENEGKQDAVKGLEPQHPKIKPYMKGFESITCNEQEEWNFSEHY